MRRPKMKAIVLAAGKAERLGPLQLAKPKPMLTVGGEVILEHNLKWLKANGVEDVFINLHHKPEVIREYFADGRRWAMNIRYSFEEKLLGTAGAVAKIVRDFPGEFSGGTVLVIYGDNFYPWAYDLKEMMRLHEKRRRAVTIGLYPNHDLQNLGHCGVVLLDENFRVKAFVEKPQVDFSKTIADAFTREILRRGLINAAVYLIPMGEAFIFGDSVTKRSEPLLDFARDVFPKWIEEQSPAIYGHAFDGPLITVDTPELLLKAGPLVPTSPEAR